MGSTTKPEVYADHPFPLLTTPSHQKNIAPENADMFVNMADEMTLVHNTFFRGLNSIYIQAPHVVKADQTSFLNYMAVWSRCLHVHHDGEEKAFFPAIERISGEKGIMDINVSQHQTFHDGIDAFDKYTQDCLAGKESYDGNKVVALIDAFGPALCTHLTDEIDTLLGLEKYGAEKMHPMIKVFADEAGESMKQIGMLTGFPWFAVNLDIHCEGDRWAKIFPPGPGQMMLTICRNSLYFWYRDWWKFGSTWKDGTMRPLYAVGPEAVTKNFGRA